MVRVIPVPLPTRLTGWMERQIAARVRFYEVEQAKEALAKAERKLLAATTPQETASAQRELIERHRTLAEAREWEL